MGVHNLIRQNLKVMFNLLKYTICIKLSGSYIIATLILQGVYYYFYQIFRNKAEAAALERKRRNIGDGSVGMLSSLLVAAMAG